MRRIYQPIIILVLSLFAILPGVNLSGQYTMPPVMDTATIENQLDYIHEKTRIYNDYRAIRDDIFLRMRANVKDSLTSAKSTILQLNETVNDKDDEISTLESDLLGTKTELEEAIKNRNAIGFLGIQMDKRLYNSIMWIIVIGLAALLVILFLVHKRTQVLTTQYKKDYKETTGQFEEYRKESRERYETLVMNHHNEIKKMKGS